MQRKTVAAAIIGKNEEALLARCLESIKGKVDAIFFSDTGSIDKTIEVARQYTSNIFTDFVWCDSMCKAFNHVQSKVPKEYDFILSIDCDEYLLSSREELQAAVTLAKDTVRVTMIAESGEKNDFGFPRLFRNTPDIHWVQPIHKHLNVPGEGEPVGNVRIVYGHSPAHERDPDRALRVLEKTVGEDAVPRNLYYLGREYWYKQRYQECIDTLQRYLKVSNWGAEAAEACLITAQANAVLGKAEEAAVFCLKAILINSNFKEAIQFMSEICTPENKPQWDRMARYANNEGVLWKRTEVEPMPHTILLSPHNDDESLYASVILFRERPLVIVITDSYIQPERGEIGCDAATRRQETINAMKFAGCPVMFLGIKDTELTLSLLRERLSGFKADKVYAPAIHEGGNSQHNIVGEIAKDLYGDRCKFYCTYTRDNLYMHGNTEVYMTPSQIDLKIDLLRYYPSQWRLASTRPHFEVAVKQESEWLLN